MSTRAPARFTFSASSTGCVVSVRVNDVPVLQGRSGRFAAPLNAWLKAVEANEVALTVEPLAKPAEAPRSEPGGASTTGGVPVIGLEAKIEAVWGEAGAGASRETVVRYLWPHGFIPVHGAAPKGPLLEAPTTTRTTFESARVPDTRLWREVKPAEMNPGHESQLRRMVGEVHEAAKAKDVDRLVSLLAFKVEDTARAFGLRPDQAMQHSREHYRAMFAMPETSLVDFAPADLVLTPMGRGCLVRLATARGQAPLRLRMGQGSWSVPLYAARLDSGWALVR